jgi:type I restriction enzyme S subunit
MFLYYFLSSKKGFELLTQASHGSVQVNIAERKVVESIPILLPPLPEQRAIASVLSSLDDKIDLLNRENQTLEQMAEAIFRQWFIEEADEKWEEGSLLELIGLVGGGTPKTSIAEYWDGSIPWLSGKDISSNHKTFVTDTEKMITEDGLNNSSTKILPKYATIISARGTVGKYCLLAQPMAFSQTNYGILPKIKGCFFFTYLLINHLVEELRASAYGCVFDTITTSTFRDSEVPIPSNMEINKFEDSVSPFFQRICQNKIQIRTLEKLRDTLLPKLMSGEVRVKLTDSEVQK